jgi:hypothetical protein
MVPQIHKRSMSGVKNDLVLVLETDFDFNMCCSRWQHGPQNV